jgi:hypothetical protein
MITSAFSNLIIVSPPVWVARTRTASPFRDANDRTDQRGVTPE